MAIKFPPVNSGTDSKTGRPSGRTCAPRSNLPPLRHSCAPGQTCAPLVIPAKAGIHDAPQQPGHSPSYRSAHVGFILVISLIFHARFHFFNAFSLCIALPMESWTSYHTRVWTPYRLVKPSTRSFLCCQTRWTRRVVTPAYSVPSGLLARMYTQGTRII